MRVSDSHLLGPEFSRNGKENITVRNLLLHNAGFPPDPNPKYCKYRVLFCSEQENPSLHDQSHAQMALPRGTGVWA